MDFGLIVLARAVHVMAGVAWAGSIFTLASVVVPLAIQHGPEGFGRWAGVLAGRLGPTAGGAAIMTVISGGYLFAILHPHDTSANGLVLTAGALAALCSLAVSIFVSRPTGRRLEQLYAAAGATATESDLPGLQKRIAISSRVSAGLLGLATLAMAIFRYAQAIVN